MTKPIIVLGGGGHAKVVVSVLRMCQRDILGFTDPDESRVKVLGVDRIGDDGVVRRYDPTDVLLVNGVGSIASTRARRSLYERFSADAYTFESVIHPKSVIDGDVALHEGVQVMAGAVVQPGCRIDENVILNTGASIDHDCRIDVHVHIGPGVTLSGGVRVGDGAHVGTGATVIQGVRVGSGSIVGAGSVVIHDVPEDATVAGVPARIIGTRSKGAAADDTD